MSTSERKRGRPTEKEWPERIDATPEEIARRVLSVPPPKEWKYMKREKPAKEDA